MTNDPYDQIRKIIDPAGEIPPTKEELIKRIEQLVEESKDKTPPPPRHKPKENWLDRKWLIAAVIVLMTAAAVYFTRTM